MAFAGDLSISREGLAIRNRVGTRHYGGQRERDCSHIRQGLELLARLLRRILFKNYSKAHGAKRGGRFVSIAVMGREIKR